MDRLGGGGDGKFGPLRKWLGGGRLKFQGAEISVRGGPMPISAGGRIWQIWLGGPLGGAEDVTKSVRGADGKFGPLRKWLGVRTII